MYCCLTERIVGVRNILFGRFFLGLDTYSAYCFIWLNEKTPQRIKQNLSFQIKLSSSMVYPIYEKKTKCQWFPPRVVPVYEAFHCWIHQGTSASLYFVGRTKKTKKKMYRRRYCSAVGWHEGCNRLFCSILLQKLLDLAHSSEQNCQTCFHWRVLRRLEKKFNSIFWPLIDDWKVSK